MPPEISTRKAMCWSHLKMNACPVTSWSGSKASNAFSLGNVVSTKRRHKVCAMAMELDEAMQRWAITEIKSYLQNETRLKAVQAARTEPTRIELSGATYTAYPECETPTRNLWQLRAQTIINDEEKQDIIPQHAAGGVGYRCFTHPICATPHPAVSAAVVSRHRLTSQSDFGTIRTLTTCIGNKHI